VTRDDIHDAYEKACRDCGLKIDYLIFDNDPPGSDFRISYNNCECELTFAHLQKLSEVFDTRDINLSCDEGTNSCRCHERWIVVKNSHPPK
jgi:hypothetical protein